MIPYFAPGSVIVRNLRRALVPIESAASYRRASDSARPDKRIINACGKALNTMARVMPGKP